MTKTRIDKKYYIYYMESQEKSESRKITQTHYFWNNAHGSIEIGSPLIFDETGKLNPPWSDERPNNVYPINSEVLKRNNLSIEIEIWNQTEVCTVAFEDESLFDNFDTSKFKKYLSIHAQGQDIKLVKLYKDGLEYTPFQGSSIDGPTAPVYNIPNIFFSNEQSLQELTIGEMDNNNIRKLNAGFGLFIMPNQRDSKILPDMFEEGKELSLHAYTFNNTDRSSLIEKICNSIDLEPTATHHKIIIFNSSCLSVDEDYINLYFEIIYLV